MRWLVPPILFVLCVALMGLLRWFVPVMMLLAFPYNLLGLVPVAVGLGLGLAGALTFRRVKTNVRPFREADTLVIEGPFRYTRNPMYLGLSLVLLGVWLLLGNLSALVGVPLFVVVADRWYIRFEENMMQRKFGPEFDAYRAKVRRWL